MAQVSRKIGAETVEEMKEEKGKITTPLSRAEELARILWQRGDPISREVAAMLVWRDPTWQERAKREFPTPQVATEYIYAQADKADPAWRDRYETSKNIGGKRDQRRPDYKSNWEHVDYSTAFTAQGHKQVSTWRLRISNGWLYKVTEWDEEKHFVVQVCFAPDSRTEN